MVRYNKLVLISWFFNIHDYHYLWHRTGSNPAVIDRIRSCTGKFIPYLEDIWLPVFVATPTLLPASNFTHTLWKLTMMTISIRSIASPSYNVKRSNGKEFYRKDFLSEAKILGKYYYKYDKIFRGSLYLYLLYFPYLPALP